MNYRNYGIDTLRLVSMFFVVILHVLGQGGVLNNCEVFTWNYNIAWLLEIIAFCAVNCFGIISGYVGINCKFKISNLIYLVLQTMFYTSIIYIFFCLFFPTKITNLSVIETINPFGKYWYFDSYCLMFMLMPLMNYVIKKLPNNLLKILIIIVPIFASFIPTSGYNFIWLSIMYVIGGILRVLEVKNKIIALVMYFLTVLLTWVFKLGLEYGSYVNTNEFHSFSDLVSNTSIFVILMSILLVIIFSNIKYTDLYVNIIKRLSPLSFGVYLAHINPLIWTNFFKNAFAWR